MPTDFTRNSNANLDRKILECDNIEAMRQVMKADLAAKGILTRSEDGNYTAAFVPSQQPTQRVAVPAADPARDTCVRVFYPSGNNRFEIYGSSEADLDEKETQIRALFGQR